MRRLLIAAAALIALAACSKEQFAKVECPGDNGSNCTTTIFYRGHPLDCILWDGSHGEVGMTCDFVKYHAELEDL